MKIGIACQVALGSKAEIICVGTDLPLDAEASHGYGLPMVCFAISWVLLQHAMFYL